MNVANLELCKELYELSRWDYEVYFWWECTTDRDGNDFWSVLSEKTGNHPAYDLGYLLRKLPVFATNDRKPLEVIKFVNGEWNLNYQHKTKAHTFEATADTPEDAAAMLCIELFKQGVLTKGEHNG